MIRQKLIVTTACVLGLASLSGCSFLTELPQGTVTTVNLFNAGDFDISVQVRFSNDDNVSEDALNTTGTLVEFNLGPGDGGDFQRSCDSLQAVTITFAELGVVDGQGPQTDSQVLRQGDDFNCGDDLIFTFDHSVVLVDFNVTVSVDRN